MPPDRAPTGAGRSRLRRPWFVLGCLGLLVLSVLYCLPRHPHAVFALPDAVAHIALFAGVGAWFAYFAGRSARVFVPLLALAVLLELAQWWFGGYPRIEWPDIAANALGVCVGFVLWWRRGA